MHVADGFYQGSRSHVLQLFAQVIGLMPQIDFYLFLDRPERLRDYSEHYTRPNVHAVRMPAANPVLRLGVQLPFLQKRYALDLLHMQNILPLLSLCPCMVTIHDLLFEAYPQFFPPLFRLRSTCLMRSAAARSEHVFTVSNYSRGEIIARYSIRPDKVTVLHNGVDTRRFRPGDEDRAAVLSRGLVPNGYILSVGRLDRRKNHVSLLEAYARMKQPLPDLVIVGQRDFRYEQVYQAVERLQLQARVKILENAADDLLPALYRHAALFVYPSWAEGFGMPPLEAMASGVPAIVCNSTALPEVVGEQAVLVEPGDVDQLAAAMQTLLSGGSDTDRLRREGPARAAAFTWEKAAGCIHARYLSYFRACGLIAHSEDNGRIT